MRAQTVGSQKLSFGDMLHFFKMGPSGTLALENSTDLSIVEVGAFADS